MKFMAKRKSKQIKILNIDDYEKLKINYLSILDSLSTKYSSLEDSMFFNLVNFKTNLSKSKHRWLNYKHGYASKLIEEIIARESERLTSHSWILDPFCGVGTTNLVCQEKNINSVGYDINPIATTVARAKTYNYSKKELDLIDDAINKLTKEFLKKYKVVIPKARVLESSFKKETLLTLLKINRYIDDIKTKSVKDFMKTVLLSIIEDCSCRIKDGNGIKLAKNKKVVEDVIDHYISMANSYRSDISINTTTAKTLFVEESYLINSEKQKYDLVIFSPPYANCFDYFEVYKLEMWVAEFVKNYDDFAFFRDKALRSHVNAKFSHNIKNLNKNVEVLSKMLETTNLWNKNIPKMIEGYFDDMTNVLKKIYINMNEGRKCYIIVANSGYRGILVPTDLLLIDIAEKIGFKLDQLIFARKIRSSSQQSALLNGNYDNLMRESIIVLEK